MSSMKELRSKSSVMVAVFAVRVLDKQYILQFYIISVISPVEFSLIGQFMCVARSMFEKGTIKNFNCIHFHNFQKSKKFTITLIKNVRFSENTFYYGEGV